MRTKFIIKLNIIRVCFIINFSLFLMTSAYSQLLPKPVKTLISERVFYTSYYMKDDNGLGSFAPFKERKNGKNSYRFEIYNSYIIFKTKSGVTTFIIDKSESRYAKTISIFAHDRLGRKFLIEYYSNKIDGTQHDDIDVMEIDEKNGYKDLTKYICKAL